MIIGCFIVLIVIAATLVAVNRAVREQNKILMEFMRKFTETTGGEWTEDDE